MAVFETVKEMKDEVRDEPSKQKEERRDDGGHPNID